MNKDDHELKMKVGAAIGFPPTNDDVARWANEHKDALMEAVEDGDLGFCVSCGEENGPVEPDARNYECEACGAKAVFGVEELLLSCLA